MVATVVVAVSFAVISYLVYFFLTHWHSKRRPHKLLYVKNAVNEHIISLCPSLKTYSVPILLAHGYLHTMVSALFRSSSPRESEYKREIVEFSDGGHVALDWSTPSLSHDIVPYQNTLLILHGLSGSSAASYVLWMVHAAEARGFQCVVMNARGCGGRHLSTPRGFNASDTSDVRAVVRHVRNHLDAGVSLYLMGFSFGAGLSIKYLSEEGDNVQGVIQGGVALCASFNMPISCAGLEHPVSLPGRVMNFVLCRGLVKWARQHEDVFREHPHIDLDHVYESRTVRDFDTRFVVPLYGYKDVWEYYSDCSTDDKVEHVRVPLLCLNSQDDPICQHDGIPFESFQRNPMLFLTVVPTGGHLGWLRSTLATNSTSWMEDSALEFLAALDSISSENSCHQIGA